MLATSMTAIVREVECGSHPLLFRNLAARRALAATEATRTRSRQQSSNGCVIVPTH